MVTTDPRVDAYLASVPDFARPILAELRQRVHDACPQVVETIKWRVPSFECRGLLAGMAAFKAYCTFSFWKETLLQQAGGDIAATVARCGRLFAVGDLPSRAAFTKALRRAVACNETGVPLPRKTPKPRPAIAVPREFAKALARAKVAQRHFAAFAPSHQREYLEWITDAKREETRGRRIEQAIEWLSEGKHRSWKYERC